MEQAYKKYRSNPLAIVLFIFAAITLSILSARSISSKIPVIISISFVYLIIMAVGVCITAFILAIPNNELRKQVGMGGLLSLAFNGFAVFFPFAVIAIVSDLMLGWGAAQAITIAGIFTSVSMLSSDFMKAKVSRAGSILLSMLASFIFIILYSSCGIIAGVINVISNLKLNQ